MRREYPAAPLVAAGVVIVRGARVVLVQRNKEPSKGFWTLPGGAVELGEPVREAAQREAREETGLEVVVQDVAAVVDHVQRDPQGRVKYHYVIIDFYAEAVGGQLHPGSDVVDARWVGLAGLDELQVLEKAKSIARQVLKFSAQRVGLDSQDKP